MQGFLITVASFIVALAILITVHEFGHFWVARKLGVKVLRFSVGFGKPLLKRVSPRDGTEFVVAAVPLGGYVKMLDEREEKVPAAEVHLAFNRQRLWKRVAIVAAGPAANLLFAVLAFWVIMVSGEVGLRPLLGEVAPGSVAADAGFTAGDELIRVGDRPTPTWQAAGYALTAEALDADDLPVRVRDADGMEQERVIDGAALAALSEDPAILTHLGLSLARPAVPARIGELMQGEPAALAGLRAGDLVVAIDGEGVAEWEALVDVVKAHPGRPLRFTIERGQQRLDLTVIPRAKPVSDAEAAGETDAEREIGYIGVAPEISEELREAYQTKVRRGPLEAVGAAVAKTTDISLLVVRIIGRMLTGQSSVDNLGGPISIAQMAGKSASGGFFLEFLALISISLAVINLFPIPLLDGGHLLYFAIEAVKGSPLSEAAQIQGQRIGLVLIAALMSLAFYADIVRLLGG